MTVRELLERLEAIEDKDMKVKTEDIYGVFHEIETVFTTQEEKEEKETFIIF